MAGKQPSPRWLSIAEAIAHCAAGVGIWRWASSAGRGAPDVVMACEGDVPTFEILTAVDLLHRHLPDPNVRVVNVVDLMKLQPPSHHPHALPDADFDEIFTKDRAVIFAYHGYPWRIHRLAYRRTNHEKMHVRSFKDESTTTTFFGMVLRNDMDRFHLVQDVIDRVPSLCADANAADLRQRMTDKRTEHDRYIREYGDDMSEASG